MGSRAEVSASVSWQTVEVMGYAHYTARGFRVCVPIVRNDGYDFIAEKDGTFLRVNVKLAGLKDRNDPTSWCISMASGASRSVRRAAAVDVFLAYLPHLDRFVELPGSFFEGARSKSKHIPRHLYLS